MKRLNFHAIVGPNGMCMCGVDPDRGVVTCANLLDKYITGVVRAERQLARAEAVQLLPKLRGWDEAEALTDWPSGFCHGETDYRARAIKALRTDERRKGDLDKMDAELKQEAPGGVLDKTYRS